MKLLEFTEVLAATKIKIENLDTKNRMFEGWSTDFRFLTDKTNFNNLIVLSACQMGDYISMYVQQERGGE